MGISWSIQPRSRFVGAGRCAGPPTMGHEVMPRNGRPSPIPGRADTAVRPYVAPDWRARAALSMGGIAVMSHRDDDNKDQDDSDHSERDYARGDQQE